jgi:arylsulfatase A
MNDQTAEDSFSFLSEITRKKTTYPKRESIIHHSSDGYFAIRKGKWKLIMCSHSGGNGKPKANSEEAKTLPPLQLFDMVSDIGETQNVYDKQPEVVKELTDLLTKYIKNGRTTEGGNEKNDGLEIWKQLTWLEGEK